MNRVAIMKMVSIGDFLTDEEIRECCVLRDLYGVTPLAKIVAARIIEPNIDRINKVLGQENDIMYLAYAVENAISQGEKDAK